MSKRPFKVTPSSSASNSDVLKNIRTNMGLIKNWLSKKEFTDKKAYICSAGPSLKLFLQKVKDNPEDYEDAVFFCVKHSLPVFKSFGITPNFCSVLDPRDIDNVSTVGINRKSLYEQASKETVFVVATLTNHTVTKYLYENGFKVLGYHTLTPEMADLTIEEKKFHGNFVISGGTSSATRCVEISFFLGFKDITLVGFDSSFDSPKPTNLINTKGQQAYMKVDVGEQSFYTTGEFVAQAQDIQLFFQNPKSPFTVKLEPGLETSLVDAIVKTTGNKTLREGSYKDYYNL